MSAPLARRVQIALCALVALLAGWSSTPAASDVKTIQSFDGGQQWINSAPLTPAALHGKIVLVDIWAYTCLNCLRTLPYEKAWYERYQKYGFTIVGVHTPEFAFERDSENVTAAAKRLGISWPIVLDNDRTIWNRYQNQAWPHEFVIDADGRVVSDHIGEGDYEQTEAVLQRLIHAAHPSATLPQRMTLLPQDSYDKPGAVCYPQTPEMLIGMGNGSAAALGNQEGYQRDHVVQYYDPQHHHVDGYLYLQGPWFDSDQAVVHARASAAQDYAALRYHAIQVVAVLKPEAGKPMTVYIEQDGKTLPVQDAGSDVRYDDQGRSYVNVDMPREYDLVMNKHFGHHDLRLSTAQYGLGIYSFDFESCEVGADR